MRYFLTCITLLLCTAQVYAQQPTGVKAEDTPNDSGGSITVIWDLWDLLEHPDGVKYTILVSESETGPFHGAKIECERFAIHRSRHFWAWYRNIPQILCQNLRIC